MLSQRLKKFILIRLLWGALLLYAPLVFPNTGPWVFYGASVFISLLSLVYVLWYLTKRRYPWLARLEIAGDLVLESYLVFFTGGAESLFTALYLLTILSTAWLLGEKRLILQTSVVSSAGYFAVSWAAYELVPDPLVPRNLLYFFYGTLVRIAIFLAVGRLSYYLSETVFELQARLKLSERLSSLGEVVSKIAHEIRNPLSAIRTAAEVLRDSLQGQLKPDEEKMLSIVDQESNRLTQTLQRILNYAKQVEPHPRLLLLDSLIERALSMVRLQSHLHPNGIVVEKKYDPLHTHLYADEEQAVGAFLNLMLNAYQAMPEGGVFRISAKEELRGTKIDLEDTGPGIPAEKLKELFLPFKSTKKGGTGLGLAEVHKMVTLHEGKIQVESRVGKGTIFHLYFPKP